MFILIIVLSFLSGYFLVYGIYLTLYKDKLDIIKRLNKIRFNEKKTRGIEEELEIPFKDRIIKPVLRWLAAITRKFTPRKKRAGLEKKLLLAGNPGGLSPGEFLAVQYTGALVLGGIGYLLAALGSGNLYLRYIYILIGVVLGYLIFEFYLRLKRKSRQNEVAKGLPDVLDLLTVSVEAGLGFDSALQRVVQKTEGAISIEFSKTLQEIKMGKPRREALRDLGLRTGVEDLNTFISAIVQADQLGVSIGNVLRVQSDQMRKKRRQKIEEKAMKAPIKMLLPMVFFIFPTIFIVLLGPAVIQMIEKLGR